MPEAKRQNERLVVLLVLGLIMLNYPFLSIFSKISLLFGIPVLYLYIFAVWSFFIGCIAVILERTASPSLISHTRKPEKTG